MMEDLLLSTNKKDDDSAHLSLIAESTHSFTQNGAGPKEAKSKTDAKHEAKANENNKNDDKIRLSILLNLDAKKQIQLFNNYNKWRFFLLTWKRLELLKLDWARRKLSVEDINNSELYQKYWYLFSICFLNN